MKATVTDVVKRIELKERKQEGIITYDVDNNYPNRVQDIVAASGMGKSCVNIYRKFIFGRGFQDVQFSKKYINRKKLTPDKLLGKIAKEFAQHGGFCLHVNYNALYQISEINFQPLAQVRHTMDDCDYPNMYAIYQDWGAKNIKKDKIIYINKFNPSKEVIDAEVSRAGGWNNYNGQILYYSNEGDQYPIPVFDSVLEDMQTDAQAKTAKFRNVSTNFMASHLVIVPKMESAPVEGAESYIQGDSKEKTDFINSLKDFQGADNNGKLMLIEQEGDEPTLELKKVEQQDNDRQFEFTESSVRSNIRQAFFIPDVLLVSIPGKLGTSDEIIDATKYYNSVTEDERLKIEEVFGIVFSIFYDKTINPSGNYSIIDRKAVIGDGSDKRKSIAEIIKDPAYTPEQKIILLTTLYDYDQEDAQKLVGNTPANGQKTLSERIGKDGVESIINILKDKELSPDQKRASLKIVFNLTEPEINLILK